MTVAFAANVTVAFAVETVAFAVETVAFAVETSIQVTVTTNVDASERQGPLQPAQRPPAIRRRTHPNHASAVFEGGSMAARHVPAYERIPTSPSDTRSLKRAEPDA